VRHFYYYYRYVICNIFSIILVVESHVEDITIKGVAS
jgi:hypothetical protein